MSLLERKLPAFSGTEAGQKATCTLNQGLRYHVLWLDIRDAVGSEIENIVGRISLLIGGKRQRTGTPAKFHALQNTNGNNNEYGKITVGIQGVAGYRTLLPIYLAEPWRQGQRLINNRMVSEASLMAWNVVNLPSFQLEVEIKEGVNTPVVTGRYEYDAVTGPIGVIAKWIETSFAAVGTENDFPVEKRDLIQAIHLFPTVEVAPKFIERLKVTLGNQPVIDLVDKDSNQAKLIGRGMSPDTSAVPRFDCVFDYDDPVDGALPTRSNLDDPSTAASEFTLHCEYNAGAAGQIPATIIQVGRPD